MRAGAATVLAFGLWSATAIVTSMPPVSPLGPQPVYGGVEVPALVSIEPVLHAAWLGTTASPVMWLAAFLVLLGASGVAVFAGATFAATVFVLGALALDASFSAALAHSSGLAIAVGLTWLAAGAAFDDHVRVFERPIRFNVIAAIVLWALAVWWDWIAIIGWPVVWAAISRGPRPRAWLAIGSLVLGAVAFVGHFAWIAGTAATVTPAIEPVVTWRDAVWAAFDARPRMPIGSYTAPELTTRIGDLLLVLSAVGLLFGVPAARGETRGAAAVRGWGGRERRDSPRFPTDSSDGKRGLSPFPDDGDVRHGLPGRWWRRTVLLSATLALGVGLVYSEWQAEVFRFSSWALAPLSAVGLTWVAAQGRRPLLVTAMLGLVAMAETIVRGSRPADGLDARGFRDALAGTLERRVQETPLLIVAEDTRIDSALVPWLAARAPRAHRAAQDGPTVSAAHESGRLVLAGPVGRRHLELAGISFADGFQVEERTPFQLSEVDGAFRCVAVRTDRWSQLPGLEYTGRLGLELPGRLGGELRLVIGDALPLPVRAATPEGRPVPLTMDPLLSGPGASAPPADYWMDGSVPEASPPWMRRVHVPADPLSRSMVSIELGRRAPRVIARLVGYEPEARGRICAAPLGPLRLAEHGDAPIALADESAFGTGWYGREGRGEATFRWAQPEAIVLVRSAVRDTVTVTLDAEPAAPVADGGTTVSLLVNGVELESRPMSAGRARYTWTAPAGVWLAGTNELWWRTSRAVRPADTGGGDTRSLALRVSGITLRRE